MSANRTPGRGILDADMRTLAGWAVQGWTWWTGQLHDLVPAALKARSRAPAVTVAWDPARTGSVVPPARGRWALVLPHGHALVRTVVLPALPAGARARMLTLEAGRLMPFGGAEAIIAAEPLEPAWQGRQKLAVAGLAPDRSAALAAMLRALPRLPAQVLVPAPEDATAGAAPAIDLLPALIAAGLLPDDAARARHWWGVALALLLFNAALLGWRDAAATGALADAVAAQQPALLVARRMTARIAADDRAATAITRARAAAEPLALMDRVTRALPPGVWLQRWGWEGATLHMAGLRPASADVAGALRRAGLPTVRYADSGGEGAAADAAATPLGIPFDIVVRVEAPQ